MLTSTMLQNSPNNIPPSAIRNTACAANADEDAPTTRFGKALEQEMNAMGDMPATHPANPNAKADDIAESTVTVAPDLRNMTDAQDSKEVEGLQDFKDLKDLEDAKNMKDRKNMKDVKGWGVNSPERQEPRETRIDTTAASPQLMDLAGILHGLIAAYRPEGRTGAQANTATDAAHSLADISMDPATATEQQGGLGVMQPVTAHPGGDGKIGMPAVAAITDTSIPMSRSPGMLAAVLAPSPRAKHAIDSQDIQSGAAIKLDPDRTPSEPQPIESGVWTPNQPINIGGPGKSLPEPAPNAFRDFPMTDLLAAGLPNTPVPLAAIPAERGIAPAAGTFAHTAPGLEPRIGATGWDNALGQKVLWMVSNQQQVAELNLNPPDLGPLQVVLSITNDQASATFVSQHADVRQALEAALPRLKEMMADSGISLGETTVSADSSQRQGEFEQQDRSPTRNGGNKETMAVPNIKSADIGMGRIHAAGNRLVDTFA